MKILAQMPLFFTILQKSKYLAPRASHVHKAGSHIGHYLFSLLSTLVQVNACTMHACKRYALSIRTCSLIAVKLQMSCNFCEN